MKKLFLLTLCFGIVLANAGFSVKANDVKGMGIHLTDLKKCSMQDNVYKIEGKLLDSDKVSNVLYKIGSEDKEFKDIDSNVALQKDDDLSLNMKADDQKELEKVIIEFEIINTDGISNIVQVPLSDLKKNVRLKKRY